MTRTQAADDVTATWRAYRVQLKGEVGWFEDGTLNLRPGESRSAERARIEACVNLPCRLRPLLDIDARKDGDS